MSRYPESFYCPITGELMKDPVVDREGNSFERIAIIEWLTRSDTSPITRNRLTMQDLAPNRSLKNSIEDAIDMEKRSLAKAVPPPPQPQATTSTSTDASSTASGGGGGCPAGLGSYNGGGIGSAVQGSLTLQKIEPSPDERDHYYVHGSLNFTADDRVPADIVVVIDISGSMDDPANTATNESSGLSILDIVKHAVKTIKQVMDDRDRLAIVSFNDRANIDMPLTRMNEQGKNEVERTLRTLVPQGSTNLWDGLQTSLEVLKVHNSKPDEAFFNNSFVFLLTDGVPNIEPPRGHIPMLQKYKDKCPGGKLPGTICTFGFGYSLDSILLRDLATYGGGMYSFIPDSGLMGTAFINCLSNVMSSSVRDVKIKLEGAAEVQFISDSSLNDASHTRIPTGIQIVRSAMQADQTFDFIKRISVPRGKLGDLVSMEAEYFVVGQPAGAPARKLSRDASNHGIPINNFELDSQIWRIKVVQMLTDFQKLLKNNFDDNRGEANARIRALSTGLKDFLRANQDRADASVISRLEDLLEDIDGQITEAVSKMDYYQRWGKHYLPSLCKAHDLQQSNNFKDPGIQHYGGPLFKSIRDIADDIFTSLPAPKPRNVARPPAQASSSSTTYRGAPVPQQPVAANNYNYSSTSSNYSSPSTTAAAVNMQQYHDRSAGCFHGDCKVMLANGEKAPVKHIIKGTKLSDGSVVVAVMKTLCLEGQAELVKLPGGLLITPYHPIVVNGKWTFPVDVSQPDKTPCEAIYSFLLIDCDGKYSSTVTINGVACITLCHGIKNDVVASHDFFGTSKVVDNLKISKGFYSADGVVTLDQASAEGTMIRDAKTHLVVGLVISDKIVDAALLPLPPSSSPKYNQLKQETISSALVPAAASA